MKSFVVAALLVAAVAGQTTMDLWKLQKEKTLLNKFDSPLVKDIYMKKLGYPWEKTVYGDNVEYLQDELLNKPIITIDELLEHPLFQEYLHLPYFARYWNTLPAFQKFVTSPYFLKFWQIPTYKQYFINPVLFYKYIYPIVTVFKTDIYSDMIVNKNEFPVFTGYERDLVKDNKYFVPTIYNHDLKFKDELLVKELMTKIYSHLYNIPEELIKEHYLTGKTFDKYTTTYPVDKLFEDKIVKDELLKKMLFNKMITGDETMYGDKLVKDDLIKKMLFKKMITGDETMYGDKLIKDELLKKMLFNKMITGDETFFGDKLVKDDLIKKMLFNKMITGDKTYMPEEFLFHEKTMKMNPFTRMMYGYNKLPFYNNKYETIDTLDKMNVFDDITTNKDLIKDELIKKELIKNELLKKEIEKFGTFETVPKSIVDFATPMMKVRTFEKKIFPETVIKA